MAPATDVLDPVMDRFMSKVEISTEPPAHAPGLSCCWLWTASTNKGYGKFVVSTRVHVEAHRWLYEQLVGPIGPGLQLDHLCRVTRCVNPDHLEPVTQRENMLRGDGPSAVNARKTHCIHGHAFTPENTYVPPKRPNGRDCRECMRRRAAETARRRRRSGRPRG
jgi:hypothetical protein